MARTYEEAAQSQALEQQKDPQASQKLHDLPQQAWKDADLVDWDSAVVSEEPSSSAPSQSLKKQNQLQSSQKLYDLPQQVVKEADFGDGESAVV
jgi:hypothetical protein